MKRQAFILKNLSIQKIPGFPEGIKSYKDFASHINIIAGPNASGKSSTARIIKQLIWPNKTNGTFAKSSAEIDKENWDIKIDSKSVTVQREGIDDQFPGIPAIETSKRYDLALHELVKDEDVDIAVEILRQSSGGYNLDEAHNNLAYSKKIKDKGAKEFKEFQEAKNDQDSINQIQKNLLKEEEKLKILKEQIGKAKEAFGLKDIYLKLIAYLQSKIKFDLSTEQYHNYPPKMEKVSGKEYNDIEGLRAEVENTDKAIEIAAAKIKVFDQKLSELKLPTEGISDGLLIEMGERLEKINEFERGIEEAKRKIKESETQELEALKSIDDSINPEEWSGLNLKKINELDQFLEIAHKTLSEKQFLEAEIDVLNKAVIENPVKPELLNEGIRNLSLWLQEQKGSGGNSKRYTLIISTISILTAIATFLVGWVGLTGIAIIIALTYLAYNNSPGSNNLVRKNDYDKTKLSQPKVWNIKGVTDKMEELIGELNEAKWQSGLDQKIKNYHTELEGLQPRLDKINATYNEWKKDLNAMPELPSSDLKNYTELYWFIDKVNKWQIAHTAHQVSLAEKDQLLNNFAEKLEKLNQLCHPFWNKKAEDYLQAKSLVNTLRESEKNRREALIESGHLKTQMDEYEKQKKVLIKKAREIYTDLDLSIGDKDSLKQLVNSLDDYRKSKEDYQASKTLMDANRNLYKAHSLFDKNKNILETLSIDQAEAGLKEFEEFASQYETLNKEITEIETNIRNAKGSHSLEEALTKQEKALLNLEQLYENNLSAIAGDLIVSQLKEKSQIHNQPQVLVRANELFTDITSGRYRLLIEDKDAPALRAYDNVLKQGQELSELSTGTRIQLLLSVRIAFIEMQEGIIKLPILADELLANSDDIRAKAIIEALIKISKEGRQVFYFTAQDDEVSKWKYYLDKDKEIKYNYFNLSGKGNESKSMNSEKADFKEFEIIQHIPSPKNTSHKEYGSLIQASPFNILSEKPEQIHIWYLTTDNDLIFNCLKKGIRKWGQLKNYIENSGIVEGVEDTIMNTLNEKVLLTERFIELYRRGRPQPIGRDILEKSDAVSSNFIEEVNAKLSVLKGDPVKLIAALKNGQVNKFRMNKAEELELFLIEEGYIDDNETLDKADILIKLNAFLSSQNMKDKEAQEFLKLLLDPGLTP